MGIVSWTRCKGRNGWDSPLAINRETPGLAAEVLNMHFYEGELGTKRAGSSAVMLSGDAHIGYRQVFRFVPGQDETAAELVIVSNDSPTQILRVAAGTTKAALTLADAIATAPQQVSAVTLNGKLYLAYDSTVNRLHVFDPAYSTTTVRRVALATPAAPNTAEDGAGGLSYTRYFRVAFTEQRSGVTVRRSLLSPSASRTIASKAGITVTKPANLSEGETHWELYVSSDNALFYLVDTRVIATTTYDYTSASVDTTTAAPSSGANTPFPSMKYLATDGVHLAGLGVWESSAGDSLTPRSGQVVFSPALDSSSIHDDERVSNTTTVIGTVNLTRNAQSEDRGLTFFADRFMAFQNRGIHGLLPTGNADAPFRRVVMRRDVGLVTHKCLVSAEDENGQPALYWLDPIKGPYRYTLSAGFQWCGKDVKDKWDTFNASATGTAAFGLYYPDLNQVQFWIATGSANDPDMVLVFDTTEGRAAGSDGVRGGWSIYTGDYAAARCGVLFSSTMGATMSRTLVPYVGLNDGTTLLKYDTSATNDGGTVFQAYIDSPAWEIEPVFAEKALLRSYVLASTGSAVLSQTLIGNFGEDTRAPNTVPLNAVATETHNFKKFEDAALTDAFTFQVRLGDGAAQASTWTLERWYAQIEQKAPK